MFEFFARLSIGGMLTFSVMLAAAMVVGLAWVDDWRRQHSSKR